MYANKLKIVQPISAHVINITRVAYEIVDQSTEQLTNTAIQVIKILRFRLAFIDYKCKFVREHSVVDQDHKPAL